MASLLDAIVRLYEYQREMNARVLDVAEQLSDDELTSTIVDGQPPIRDTLLHLVECIQLHLSWWNDSMDGESSFAREFQLQDYPDVKSLKNLSISINSELEEFTGSLGSDADLDRVYRRSIPGREVRNRLLWEMMLHVVNHSTQHRSEVALMLTKLGYSPGDMDIL